MTDTYVPSPSERVAEQVAAYETSNGAEGGTLEGRPVVILTAIGARSGAVRKNPVMRIPHGDNYIAVASAAGAAVDPAWYRNLIAHPDLWLQDGAVKSRFRARGCSATRRPERGPSPNSSGHTSPNTARRPVPGRFRS